MVADRLCNHPHGFGRRSIGECIAENIWANGPRDTVVFSQIAATIVSSTSFSSMIATGGLYKRQGLLLNRGQVPGTVPPESWPLFRSREVMRKLPTDRFAHATSATFAFTSVQIQFLNAAIPGSPPACSHARHLGNALSDAIERLSTARLPTSCMARSASGRKTCGSTLWTGSSKLVNWQWRDAVRSEIKRDFQ